MFILRALVATNQSVDIWMVDEMIFTVADTQHTQKLCQSTQKMLLIQTSSFLSQLSAVPRKLLSQEEAVVSPAFTPAGALTLLPYCGMIRHLTAYCCSLKCQVLP